MTSETGTVRKCEGLALLDLTHRTKPPQLVQRFHETALAFGLGPGNFGICPCHRNFTDIQSLVAFWRWHDFPIALGNGHCPRSSF